MSEVPISHAGRVVMCVLVIASLNSIACGGSAAPSDASVDSAGDSSATPDTGMDASLDASLDAGPVCSSDVDCADLVDSACLRGHCRSFVCFSRGDPTADACPAGLDCIDWRCGQPACGACDSDEVGDPTTRGCTARVDPVACRAGGGLYVRGRCLMPSAGDEICAGGFASETVPDTCDAPTVAGANLDSTSIVRVGPFLVVRVVNAVVGSLVGERRLESEYLESKHFVWRFSYLDPSVLGGAAEAATGARLWRKDPPRAAAARAALRHVTRARGRAALGSAAREDVARARRTRACAGLGHVARARGRAARGGAAREGVRRTGRAHAVAELG